MLTTEIMITGRPPKNSNYVARQRVNFRFHPDLVAALKTGASKARLSATDYVTMALLAQLSRDGVKL